MVSDAAGFAKGRIMRTRTWSGSTIAASTAVLVAAFLGAAPAQAANPSFLDLCSNLGSVTSDGSCTMPGVLGDGKTVSIAISAIGGGGGGGFNSPYAVGGSGAEGVVDLQVPDGSTIHWVIGKGGTHSNATGNDEGASGGGSTAVLLGSTVLIEVGGGGGATNDVAGGSAINGGTGGAGDTVCSGRGGNVTGSGSGGAAGSTAGLCAGVGQSPWAGQSGHNGLAGTGGNGGTPNNGTTPNPGGAGYAAGGSGGGRNGSVMGGGGGGGGYGGGGGGTAAEGANGGTGAGGAGGSYLATSQYIANFGVAGNGGNEGNGGDGDVYFSTAGPSVKTLASAPSAITKTTATVHSLVNANGNPRNAKVEIAYNTTPNPFAPNWLSGNAAPAIVGGSSDTAITAQLAQLAPCTTYYYVAMAASEGQAALVSRVLGPHVLPRRPASSITFGAVESFRTICQLPLSVSALPANRSLPRTGTTTVVNSAVTTANGRVLTMVRCAPATIARAGDLVYCRATTGANGKVNVTTLGYPNVRVTVTQQAVPLPGRAYLPSLRQVHSWTVS